MVVRPRGTPRCHAAACHRVGANAGFHYISLFTGKIQKDVQMHRLLAARSLRGLTYGQCFLLYVAMFIVVFAQAVTGGKTISPSRQDAFLAIQPSAHSQHKENDKFSDFTLVYVPEAKVFLEGRRSGWLTTWTPYNELGRPTAHMADLSPAYLPNAIISLLTTDAFTFVTLVALLAAFLAGSFAFLLARELALSPAAALVAGLALGISPSLIYWATFPMFASAYGWTMATLYGVARYVRKRDLLAWAILAFSIYSLVMTAYPVMIMYHAYLMAGFLVYLYLRQPGFPRGLRGMSTLSIGLASAALLGCLAAFPAVADTWAATTQSARMHASVEFLRANLPSMSSAWDWSRFVAFWTFPQVTGDPIAPAFSPLFNGRSVAPFVVFLLCASPWRRTWGWWLAAFAMVLADASAPVFAFGVNYLGLGLSRSVPTVHAVVPLVMIAAISMDALIPSTSPNDAVDARRGLTRRLFLATVLYGLLLANAVAWSIHMQGFAAYRTALLFALYAPVLWVALQRRWIILYVAVVLFHLCVFDRTELLVQSRKAVTQSSPLTAELQQLLSDGSRYAVLKSAEDFMPANMNAQMFLRSVHTYDSLSPVRYQDLIRRLGGESASYGRTNRAIDADSIGTTDFMLSNIGAVVTRQPISSPLVQLEGSFNGLSVYSVKDRWGAFVRVPMALVKQVGDAVTLPDSPAITTHAASLVSDRGDTLELALRDNLEAQSVLVMSQSYNPRWDMQVRVHGTWAHATAVLVNGAYQGVLLPAQADAVSAAFRPWIRWAWLGHAAFGAIALILLVLGFRSRFQRGVPVRHNGHTLKP